MEMDDFEFKRAMDTYFRHQFELQEVICNQLARIEKQNRALLAIFGAAAREMSGT